MLCDSSYYRNQTKDSTGTPLLSDNSSSSRDVEGWLNWNSDDKQQYSK